ncbi:MAG TPA: ABC transporter ATP-binding protein [Pyrinomonadaceae bacterium]|jgi:lipoprotein-releasing system ATP-binding protein|nr:ABC transporter ATP-binding protein [Pyrinomonadaceae bacterium]
MAEFGLDVVDLRKSFVAPNGERIEVLRSVSFTAKHGEVIAITGPSGSGKSTLLQLLGGLENADHGTITFDGNDITNLNPRKLAKLRRQQIGFVFQFHNLLHDLSAIENVALPLLIAREKRQYAYSRAANLLEDAHLTGREDHPVSHLSGGEQQRVALARALVTHPRLLLADEPTGNVDAEIAEELGKALVTYVRNNGAVGVMATHSASLANLCDRVFVLQDGRVSPVTDS